MRTRDTAQYDDKIRIQQTQIEQTHIHTHSELTMGNYFVFCEFTARRFFSPLKMECQIAIQANYIFKH